MSKVYVHHILVTIVSEDPIVEPFLEEIADRVRNIECLDAGFVAALSQAVQVPEPPSWSEGSTSEHEQWLAEHIAPLAGN